MEINSTQVPSPLLLAYLGDSVMEVLIRRRLIEKKGMTCAKCNVTALEFVTAAHQAEAAKRIQGHLTEEEKQLFTRAKNAKSNSAPRNVPLYSYRLATAFEALLGYNYLSGNDKRNIELLELGYPQLKYED